MGQCIYVAERTSTKKEPVTREVASEKWMDPASVGRTLGQDHFMNTTIGVWFYESDLHDKRALRKRLMDLVKCYRAGGMMGIGSRWMMGIEFVGDTKKDGHRSRG